MDCGPERQIQENLLAKFVSTSSAERVAWIQISVLRFPQTIIMDAGFSSNFFI